LRFGKKYCSTLTLELEGTMNRIAEKRSLDGYDAFLIYILKLLVMPNHQDPQTDRDQALGMLAEHMLDAQNA
jgi:hypothetical protein